MAPSHDDADSGGRRIDSSRRRLLGTLGTGAALSIAGCGGDGGGDGSGDGGSTGDGGGDGSGGDGGDGGDGGTTETEGDGGVSGATYVNASPLELRHLDPHAMNDSSMVQILLLYEPLVGREVGNASVVKPKIATAWEGQDNAQTWVFQIREGITFDDGTPLDGYAVKRSLERTNKIQADQSLPYGWMDSVEETGDYEVTVHANEPYAPAPQYLTHVTASIINPTALDEHFDDDQIGHGYFAENVHGSGPFEFVSWTKGDEFVAKRKADYWAAGMDDVSPNLAVPDDANVANYQNRIIRETLTAKQLLVRGELDWVNRMPWTQMKDAATNDSVELFNGGTDVKWIMAWFNNANPIMSDVDLRKALAYVVDYEGLINGFLEQTATPLGTPWQEGIWPRREDLQYSRDLAKAEEHMRRSDYSGQTLDFWGIRGSIPDAVLEGMAANFAEIGVDVEIQTPPIPQFFDRQASSDTFAHIGIGTPWPDYRDPDGLGVRWWSKMWPGRQGFKNLGFWEDERYDELFMQGRQTTNRQDRIPIYEEMQRILYDDPPAIWLGQQNFVRPHNSALSNLEFTSGSSSYVPVHKFHKG